MFPPRVPGLPSDLLPYAAAGTGAAGQPGDPAVPGTLAGASPYSAMHPFEIWPVIHSDPIALEGSIN